MERDREIRIDQIRILQVESRIAAERVRSVRKLLSGPTRTTAAAIVLVTPGLASGPGRLSILVALPETVDIFSGFSKKTRKVDL